MPVPGTYAGRVTKANFEAVAALANATETADAAKQPLDADLTAIAALTTTAYGRAKLAQVDAAAGRTDLGLGTAATANTGTAVGNVPVLGTGAKLPASVVPAATITNVVEGQQLLAYGHSYSSGAGATNGAGYLQRLSRRLSLSTIFNRYQSATSSYYACVTKTNGDHNFLTAANGFFVNFDSVINDAADSESLGSTAALQAPGVAKLTNMVKYLLALTQRRSNQASTSGAYTGTWTANTADAASPIIGGNGSGTSSSTTTLNDSVTFTGITANAKVAVMLQGIDDVNNATAGAAFSITSAGMTTVTGTTGGQFNRGRDTGVTRAPMIVVVQLTGGATSLTITKTDASGKILYVNGLIVVDQQYAPFVILVKNPYVSTVADATVDRHNAALDAAKASLASAGIVIVDPNAAGWDKTIHTSTFDTLHPNDRGHGFLADTYAATVFATPYHVATASNQRNTTTN